MKIVFQVILKHQVIILKILYEAGINRISTIYSSCLITAQRSDQNFESTNIIFNPTSPLNFDNIFSSCNSVANIISFNQPTITNTQEILAKKHGRPVLTDEQKAVNKVQRDAARQLSQEIGSSGPSNKKSKK